MYYSVFVTRQIEVPTSHERKRMKRVLLIEDDRDIVELVRYNLEREGFQVVAANDGATGLVQVRKSPPDMLLLDLMLPKLSGLEICRDIRRDQALNRLPILMLTARGEEADRVVGLEMGADDYVTKPFSPRELVARVKALLRRAIQGNRGIASRADKLVLATGPDLPGPGSGHSRRRLLVHFRKRYP